MEAPSFPGPGSHFSRAPSAPGLAPALRKRRRPDQGVRLVERLTATLVETFQLCNPTFKVTTTIPRRMLTNPSEGCSNNGLDNADANLICKVNDKLEAPGRRYVILDLLGQGTFGQVFRCQDSNTKQVLAVKVIKNRPAYRTQAQLETQVARLLNERYDPNDEKNIVRLLDCFQAHGHLCLVFELLSINLYELLKQNQFRGLPQLLVCSFMKQIVEAMTVLEQASVIHCDLKPENVLLCNSAKYADQTLPSPMVPVMHQRVKIIDFGSACFEGHTAYSYIQSRFYRSPEVLLGLPYDSAIDMWSLGCICLEMFLGLPIFPGVSDHNQLSRIIEMVGCPPDFMLDNGKNTLKFFHRLEDKGLVVTGGGRPRYRYVLKTPEEYARDTNTTVPVIKKYFKQSTIPDIIDGYPMPNKKEVDKAKEREMRQQLTHFCLGLLQTNPWRRWTPRQAARHPFLTGQPMPQDLATPSMGPEMISDHRHEHQHPHQLQPQHDLRHWLTEGHRPYGSEGSAHHTRMQLASTAPSNSRGFLSSQPIDMPKHAWTAEPEKAAVQGSTRRGVSTGRAASSYQQAHAGSYEEGALRDLPPKSHGLPSAYSSSYGYGGGTYAVTDFGYALQRPHLRYDTAADSAVAMQNKVVRHQNEARPSKQMVAHSMEQGPHKYFGKLAPQSLPFVGVGGPSSALQPPLDVAVGGAARLSDQIRRNAPSLMHMRHAPQRLHSTSPTPPGLQQSEAELHDDVDDGDAAEWDPFFMEDLDDSGAKNAASSARHSFNRGAAGGGGIPLTQSPRHYQVQHDPNLEMEGQHKRSLNGTEKRMYPHQHHQHQGNSHVDGSMTSVGDLVLDGVSLSDSSPVAPVAPQAPGTGLLAQQLQQYDLERVKRIEGGDLPERPGSAGGRWRGVPT